MSFQDKPVYDDQVLTRYLLGALSSEEAERLDQLSIADDETAARIQSVENDLVDSYVRSELTGRNLQDFESFYLNSARRREKVHLARALFTFESRMKPEPARMEGASVPSRGETGHGFRLPRFLLSWQFASAAVLLIVVAGFFFLEYLRLRRLNDLQVRQAAIEQQGQQLRKQLDDDRRALAELGERSRQSETTTGAPKTVALLLPPPTRGAARLPTVSVPAGTDFVLVLLELETGDFPAYRATLKQPAGNTILWSSGKLEAESLGERKVLTISLPASLLRQQNYLVDLTGLPTRASPEPIGSYSFRVAVR